MKRTSISSFGITNLVLVLLIPFTVQAQEKMSREKYDVAAFYWPAYHPDPRFKDIHVFPDGKGEWEAIYKAKPKFAGHDVPKVPLWGYEEFLILSPAVALLRFKQCSTNALGRSVIVFL